MFTSSKRNRPLSAMLIAVFGLLSNSTSAQNLHIVGGAFHMASNSNTYVLGNLFLEKTNVTGPGKMHLVGGAAQTVSGGDSAISKLVINNTNNVSLISNLRISDTMFLTAGRFILGVNHLQMHNNAGFVGTFDATRMIVADTTGTVRVGFGAAGTKLVPIGDVTGTPEYSPATLELNSATFGSVPYLAINLRNAVHPNVPDATNNLTRYWTISENDISAFDLDASFVYVDADINGTETDLLGQKYDGTWTVYNAVDDTNNEFTTAGVTSLSDFTASGEGAIVVFTKVLLQGAYDYDNPGTMFTTLRNGNGSGLENLIPEDQPYVNAPWYYLGGEKKDTGNMDHSIVDWVLVELRTTFDGAPVTNGIRAGLLKNNGEITDTSGIYGLKFPGVMAGNYFIVIKHRNHLPIMSYDAVSLSGSSSEYDFTSLGQKQAFGMEDSSVFILQPMVELFDGYYAMWGGDTDEDGIYIVRYSGFDNDPSPILDFVGGPGAGSATISEVYSRNDTNLDRQVRFSGFDNDITIILDNVGGPGAGSSLRETRVINP